MTNKEFNKMCMILSKRQLERYTLKEAVKLFKVGVK